MREDPGLDKSIIIACLERRYGLRVASIEYLPIGYDLNAAVYKISACDGAAYFLKIRSGPLHESGLLASRALIDHGIRNVLAPVRTRTLDLWCPLDGYPGHSTIVYPFIEGESALTVGMSDDQWREFGATLRAVHDSGLGERLAGRLPVERFALPSAALVRQVEAAIARHVVASAAAARLAAFWWANRWRISRILDRAEELGRSLHDKSFELVLCHGDIHAANILVGVDGRIWLVDWDGPLVAPRERDLLFVIGSRIARPVEPSEEALFFEGYGPVAIDPAALIYYRYERIVEDLGEFGRSVLLDASLGEQAREAAAELAMSFFAPGGDIDRAETVTRSRWSGSLA